LTIGFRHRPSRLDTVAYRERRRTGSGATHHARLKRPQAALAPRFGGRHRPQSS
jgi:hypothetical protein